MASTAVATEEDDTSDTVGGESGVWARLVDDINPHGLQSVLGFDPGTSGHVLRLGLCSRHAAARCHRCLVPHHWRTA
jgi:hypothetical protein